MPLFLGLGFRQTEAGDLRIAIGCPGYRPIIQGLSLQTRHILHGDGSLCRGHVGEGQFSGDVADSINVGYVGSHHVVYLDTAILNSDAHRLQPYILYVGSNPGSHQHLLTVKNLFGPFLGDGNRHTVSPRHGAGHAGSCHNLNPVAVKAALKNGADVLVFSGNQPGQQLDDGNFHPVHPVDISKLDADGAPANNHDAGGKLIENDSFPAGYNLVAVNGKRGDRPGTSAGGEDNVLGIEPLTVRSNLHYTFANQLACTLYMLHIVLAQQKGDAPGVAVNYPPAPGVSHRIVGVEIIETKSKVVGPVDVGQYLSVLQEGLTGDAAPVQANPAKAFFLYNRSLEPQLSGADRRNIPARPRPNHHQVVVRIRAHYLV